MAETCDSMKSEENKSSAYYCKNNNTAFHSGIL